ncbi:protein SOGA3-like isoform X2 [Mercenaria mercenaria]|uniref:protein SOGA3-like isoform X2 n=1 Tax=Mercenaria mercenaria TaxID=6596 RepID=UPI00234FA6E8|nr:protein SOGA3-like isoform X2 [Mercenaria mercenaria]
MLELVQPQNDTYDLKEIKDETVSNKWNASNKSGTLQTSTLSAWKKMPTPELEGLQAKKMPTPELEGLQAKTETLQAELDAMVIENKMYRTQIYQHETAITSYQEEIRRLETVNLELKTRGTVADTEAAKLNIENQKLLQKIVGMEENQAMMSRAELHSMIAQLEEAELKSSCKPATELSGIRTNPADMSRKKTALTQEDRQLSWRLSKTEARLSQSEDENKKLREDLKEMLDSTTKLQQIIVSDDSHACPVKKTLNAFTMCKDAPTNRRVSVSTETETEDSDTDIAPTSLNARLKNAEKDQARLQKEYDCLEKSFKMLLVRLQQCEEETIVNKQNNEISKTFPMEFESDLVLINLKELEKEQNDLKASMMVLDAVCVKLNERIDVLYIENVDIKTLNDTLTKQNREAANETEKRVKEIEALRNELNQSKVENKRLSEEFKKYSQQLQKRKDTGSKKDLTNIEQDLSDMKKKYEEANRRLKELTTPKQTKSLDLNLTTPSSLAERFRHELYEHHWKQAFDKMTKKMKKDEKKAIHILGEICTEAYLFCKRAARTQMDTVTSSLVSPTANHYRSNQLNKRHTAAKSLQDNLPEDLRRRLLHYRCRPSQDMLNIGVSDFLNQIDYDRTRFLRNVSERDLNEVMTYIGTCFELAWCMAVQDPPMYLLFKVKHGFEIDSEKFDRYYSRGKRVDYVIWPAVLAEEGGACLQKGVMHALPERA